MNTKPNNRKAQVRLMFNPNVLNEASSIAQDLKVPLSAYVDAAVAYYNTNYAERSEDDGPQTLR